VHPHPHPRGIHRGNYLLKNNDI